jgi:hypothetical protein
VIRHAIVKIEPAEPAIGQVQGNLLAEPPLGLDAIAIPDNQHSDEKFRINRGTPRMGIIGFELFMEIG